MSKDNKKEQLANPFAKLSKMNFPDKDNKKKAARVKSEQAQKAKLSDIPFDEARGRCGIGPIPRERRDDRQSAESAGK